MATYQISKTIRIWTKFRSMGNVQYDPKTNELISAGTYGAQDSGTLIVVQELDAQYSGEFLAKEGFKKYWVPANARHEPQTRNLGGGKGAWRDIENTERVDQIVNRLKSKLGAA